MNPHSFQYVWIVCCNVDTENVAWFKLQSSTYFILSFCCRAYRSNTVGGVLYICNIQNMTAEQHTAQRTVELFNSKIIRCINLT